MEENVLELISKVTEFNDISEFCQDSELDAAMAYIVQLFMDPGSIPQAKLLKTMVRLQAISAKMGMQAMYYKYVEKSPAGTLNYKKKNTYIEMHECLERLVDALKIVVRYTN